MSAIQTINLRKSYGLREVLHGIDLDLPEGRLVGFLGPNGAGKTTTIRVLLGLIHPSHGAAKLLGQSVAGQGRRIRRDIGYLPGEVRFYSSYTGRAILNFLARARAQDCRDEIERLGTKFDLELGKRVRKYSTGMKQKLGLIQALMHKPKLLILDEPTSGLDPLVKKAVFSELRACVRQGRTVMFSSHSLNEVEELCDEVLILREGRVIEHEQIETLRSRALRRVTITFLSSEQVSESTPANLKPIRLADKTLVATWTGPIDELVGWLSQRALHDVMIERPSLEDLFMAYYSSEDLADPRSDEASVPVEGGLHK